VKTPTLLFVCLVLANAASAQNWPSFRGRNASGVADGGHPPTIWNAEKSVNIAWKTSLPGFGHSSPVVWGDRVFITTAVSAGAQPEFTHGNTQSTASAADNAIHDWRVYCLSKTTGRVLWERSAVARVPKTKRHVKSSQANSTPATDGLHIVALFGSEGLYCFNVDGRLLWKRDLGILDGGWSSDPNAHWGFGSSPIIYKTLVIVQCDTQKDSFIAAFDLKDGKQVWRTSRNEDTSWSTPAIYEGKSRDELVTSGTKYYRGYDPMTGNELWKLADGSDVKIPTPLVANQMFFLGGGTSHVRNAFYAVRPGARGELVLADNESSNTSIAWRNHAAPHVLTPILYRDLLYVCTDNGVLTQYNAKTGEMINRERLGGRGSSFSASPVAADGRLYFASEDGDVFVISAGEYELLATNSIGEVVMATPAISDGILILRGQSHVFGIQEQRNTSKSNF
jgi:outer membrane protein assembly factor BamB